MIGLSAVSGIEIALWDILAKSLDVPVWRLLGGRCRNHLRTYTHLGMGDMTAVYDSGADGRLAERAQEVVAAGYDALKVVPLPYLHYLAGPRETDRLSESMAALRQCVGPDIDIMLDFRGRPSSAALAGALLRAVAPARPLFVEEPVAPENLDGLAHLTAEAQAPIARASGYRARRDFAEALARRAMDIAQPGICHNGGLWETRKIAAMCETAGVGVAPHNPLGPIAGVAALHLGIVTPNVVIQEEMTGAVPWYDDIVTWPIDRRPGCWDAPERPGLGIEVNEAEIARHPFEQEITHATGAILEDGTIVDW